MKEVFILMTQDEQGQNMRAFTAAAPMWREAAVFVQPRVLSALFSAQTGIGTDKGMLALITLRRKMAELLQREEYEATFKTWLKWLESGEYSRLPQFHVHMCSVTVEDK